LDLKSFVDAPIIVRKTYYTLLGEPCHRNRITAG
jgi:hypothetical protein